MACSSLSMSTLSTQAWRPELVRRNLVASPDDSCSTPSGGSRTNYRLLVWTLLKWHHPLIALTSRRYSATAWFLKCCPALPGADVTAMTERRGIRSNRCSTDVDRLTHHVVDAKASAATQRGSRLRFFDGTPRVRTRSLVAQSAHEFTRKQVVGESLEHALNRSD